MKQANHLLLSVLCLLVLQVSIAQKKVVILGSSTAAGAGASPTDSSWARKLQFHFRQNMTDNVDTPIVNLAYPGFVTYQVMPTGYPLPANRAGWPPDPARNMTAALNENPDVIIVNLPTNDVNLPDYQKKETMDNFRYLFQQMSAVGVRCFITTTQPRNDMSVAQRQMLRELYDSIVNNFGNYAVDFWTDLVTNDGQNLMRSEVNADNIHPNNLGHARLFARVRAEDLFTAALPLPVHLKEFRAELRQHAVRVRWETSGDEAGMLYELQRGSDGRQFGTVYEKRINASRPDASHEWNDAHPLPGKSFYRLKITEDQTISYSPIRAVTGKGGLGFLDLKIKPAELEALVGVETGGAGLVRVIDAQGVEVKKLPCVLTTPSTSFRLNLSGLKPGAYYLHVSGAGQQTVRSFAIL